jgi:hypothetical protein
LKFRIGNWDDIRSPEEIFDKAIFAFIFMNRDKVKGRPYIVLKEDEDYLYYIKIGINKGLCVSAEGQSGKSYIYEMLKDYTMFLRKDPREVIAKWLKLIKCEEYIL